MTRHAGDWLLESHGGHDSIAAVAPVSEASAALLRECFELFFTSTTGLARLSIETSSDLFEMDGQITVDEIYDLKSKRGEWIKAFEAALRDFFERRLVGQRRRGRRPDAVQSASSLQVLNDSDTCKQSALLNVCRRLATACEQELGELDCRIAVLLEVTAGRDVSNPFSTDYLLDAVGVTSRAVYPDAHIWRPLMERVTADFLPAINNIYRQLNRYLADRDVLPEIGASLRARSDLRPADDHLLLTLYNRLFNEVKPSLKAWRKPDADAAQAVGFELAPLTVNPYVDAIATMASAPASAAGGFPRLSAMTAFGPVAALLETLNQWQRSDPMAEHVRKNPSAAPGADAPVNRIPWIHAALDAQITDESTRTTLDVVALLFDYIFRDPSIAHRIRRTFEGLQIPLLKAALADPTFFFERNHPARRLIDDLAAAAIGADDDADYGKALEALADSIVAEIRAGFELDMSLFERMRSALDAFTSRWQEAARVAMQPHVEAGLARESSDAHASQARLLVRNRLAGLEIPFEVRSFLATVWADCLAHHRQDDGSGSDAYAAAIRTMDDLLWTINAKERTAQKTRLSKMIPPLVTRLRAGGTLVQAADGRMKRFLDALYELHIAAVKPGGAPCAAPRAPQASATSLQLANGKGVNLHDFVADVVPGTWFAFGSETRRVHARLSWVSPLRTAYVFAGRSPSTLFAFAPDELAWEVISGRAVLVIEPVPLYDRAVSVTLEFLAQQSLKQGPAVADGATDATRPAVALELG